MIGTYSTPVCPLQRAVWGGRDTFAGQQQGGTDGPLLPLHTPIASSSKAPCAAERASVRFISSASLNAERRFSINSSRVWPCPFTPGISPIQPIHQPPSHWTTAV